MDATSTARRSSPIDSGVAATEPSTSDTITPASAKSATTLGINSQRDLESQARPKTKGATDLPNCEFVLWFGSDPMAANFPFVAQARKLVDMLNRESPGKLAVVDPRCNVAASKADWWMPILPGTDAALALAIGRYIIDNGLYNTTFLENTTQDAVDADGELNLTDAPRLVKIVDGHPTAYLRSDEAGLGGTADDFVVWSDSTAVQASAVSAGVLLPGQVTVNSIVCKTAFEIYADQARSKTLDEWAAICQIDRATIQAVATELTSHGRKASVEHYRGPVQHTNGTYTSWAIINLNTLIGNFNWQGGHIFTGKHWHETGGKSGNHYSPKGVTNGVSTSGVQITRINENYEDSADTRERRMAASIRRHDRGSRLRACSTTRR